MDKSKMNHNKHYTKKLSVEFKKPFCHSLLNENEERSNINNADKETLNLFKGIVKVTQKSLIDKRSPETQSNTINNNFNNIFDFTNCLYNNEEHLDDNQIYLIKIPGKGHKKIISPQATINSRDKKSEKSKSSLELSKEQNLKKSLFNNNIKKHNRLSVNYIYNHNNNSDRKKPKRGSAIGNMTHKNRNNHDFNFFFKLKEKDKIPSKTPYLDKIMSVTNKNLNYKSKTHIHPSKKSANISLIKQNSQEINKIKISKTNNKSEKEKEKSEIIQKSYDDKSEKDKDKKISEKEQDKKKSNNETIKLEKNEIIPHSEKKVKKANIIFNILNKPFVCCLK